MTTAHLSGAGAPYPPGAIKVTLTSYSATCIPTVHYLLPGGQETTYTAPFVISTPGTTTVEYWGTDLSNNTEEHRFVDVAFGAAVSSISLSATGSSLTYPSIATLTGLTKNLASPDLILQARRVDQSNWTNIATATSSTGRFVFLHVPLYGYYYRAVSGLDESNIVRVNVKVPLSKPAASATQVASGRSVKFSGTIRPAHPVGPHASDIKFVLQLQRQDSRTKKWSASTETSISLSAAVDNDTTRWDYVHRSSKTGRWRLRFVHECPRHARSYSAWREFVVVK